MKKNIVGLLVILVSFLLGFSLSAYKIGVHASREVKQLVINEKLILMNVIATDISNAESSITREKIISILCDQLPYLHEEAIEAGESTVSNDIPNHIEYSKFVAANFESIASVLDVNGCVIK